MFTKNHCTYTCLNYNDVLSSVIITFFSLPVTLIIMKLETYSLHVHDFKASEELWVLSEAALRDHDYHITTTSFPV